MIPHKKTLTLVLLGLITLAFAQVDTAWTRRWTSSGAYADYAYVMTVDNAGNVYAAGSVTFSSSSSRAQVIKYSTNGDVLWIWTDPYTGTFNERASSIVVAPSGNVYICGYTMRVNAGDYLIVKLNGETGDTIWFRTYDLPGTGGYDFARRIAIDASENVYVTGYGSRGTGYGTSDYGTISYDANGNFRWAAFYDGGVAQGDQAYSIATDGSSVYVTGYSNPYATGLLYDIITIKYNAATGDTAVASGGWVRRFNGVSDSADYGRDITVDGSGNVYITGSTKIGGTNTNDFVTIKYTSTGDVAWIRTYNGPDNLGDAGWWIKLDNSGNVYVYGNTTYSASDRGQDLCVVKYDNNGNQQWVATYNGPNAYEICPDETGQNPMVLDASGNIYLVGTSKKAAPGVRNDIVTLKYNSSGNFQWEVRYDYNNMDSSETAKSVGVDNAGNVYFAGHGNGLGTYIDWVVGKIIQGAPSSYTITANAYGPGTIVPSGLVIVPVGEDTTFTITPNLHAQLDSLVVDGINHGSDSTTYRFEDVTSNHT
ncbi:MAG: SBBP repeat-containing protein, partial [candidate division WOR-3 bacterium]